jgi:hypothetical protein
MAGCAARATAIMTEQVWRKDIVIPESCLQNLARRSA